MSQFPGSFGDQPYGHYSAEPRKTSGLAITALVMSLIGVIPCCGWITAPIGLILGIVAVFLTGANSPRKGRGLAISAALIGLIAIIFWIGVMVWGYRTFEVPAQRGPREAMSAGFAGDYAGFRSQFFGPAARANDAEVQAFIQELRTRYGDYQSMWRDDVAMQQNLDFNEMMKPIQDLPYQIQFTNQTVSATIQKASADPQTNKLGVKFGTITIHDPNLGDLTYPPGTSLPSATAPSSPSAPPATNPDSSSGESSDGGSTLQDG